MGETPVAWRCPPRTLPGPDIADCCAAAPCCNPLATLRSFFAHRFKVTNQFSSKHASQNFPLKLSMKAFCTGLLGSMKCSATPCA
jgi:hypothetical protein